jgi:CBS domain-containing protein
MRHVWLTDNASPKEGRNFGDRVPALKTGRIAMQVHEIMSADPKYCIADMDLREAARMMVACDCGAMPVVESADHTKPVGIITDRDIACRAVAEGKNPLDTTVAECMSQHLAVVPADAVVEECCEIMEKSQVRRLLVTDDQGRLCGIVSQADIALHLSNGLTAEVVKQVSQSTEEPSAVS